MQFFHSLHALFLFQYAENLLYAEFQGLELPPNNLLDIEYRVLDFQDN